MKRHREHRRVLIGFRLVEALRDVLEGVGSYVRKNRLPWQVQCVDADQFPQLLNRATADGAITVVGAGSHKQLRQVARAGVPTVNMLHDVSAIMPSVLSDDAEIGRIAAKEFLGRGFRQFAFVGFAVPWSQAREAGFSEVLRAAGHACQRCEGTARISKFGDLATKRVDRLLAKWLAGLAGLAQPVAVFAASDAIGTRVLAACEAAGVEVPGGAAVMGVDNIVHVCELAEVPMSSVSQDFAQLGFEAAATLGALMDGRPISRRLVLVPPGRVVARRSTDVLAFEDDYVTAAMRLIHDPAASSTGMGIKELLSRIPVSRRWLDERFKALVGHSVSGEIRRRRLEQIRDLLLRTDLSVKQIALRAGFSRPENMVRLFRDAYGVPPQAYRARNVGGAQARRQ